MIIIKRLYITDLDGTLLNSKGEVSGNTGKIINSLTEKGIYFTFATARSVYSAKSITAGLNINIPYILMNGVSIYNPENNTYIKNEYIPPEISSEIIRVFKANNVRCFMYRIQDNILTAYFTEITSQVMESFAESRKKNYNKPFVQCADLSDIADSKTIYFNTTGEYEEILSVKNSIGNIKGINYAFYRDTYTGKYFLEIFSGNASKASGIKYLRNRYEFDEVICFGDNLNDVTMFEEADIKIAVGNAVPELKEMADFITSENDRDGVAEWLTENYGR
ncbi:MAG: Cof-type HAD-IIB family hydrolase [Ruminococcus sp.]|nr:Cof-type HAD-IIB family hydrolase [Ruminococcus sp.]